MLKNATTAMPIIKPAAADDTRRGDRAAFRAAMRPVAPATTARTGRAAPAASEANNGPAR